MHPRRDERSRREFLKTLGAGAAAVVLGPQMLRAQRSARPNIVIILTDDQGYGDLGRYGATGFTTPNIDRMASEGVTFTQFTVSEAVCSASRSSLLTGCYAERIGIRGALTPSSTIGLDPEEETIASMLKKKGYATGIFGKWHLGAFPEFLPLQHGFDEYAGLPYSNDMWPVDFDGRPITDGVKTAYPPLPLMEGNAKVDEVRTLADQDKLTTFYTQRAVHFIERHKDHPFFLYVPHSMPHVPLGVSDRFRGKSAQGKYGDVIMEIDWSVGEILQAIRKNGLDDSTLVIFTSDNGPWMNFGNHAGSAGPLREGKGAMWEGGVRVPCVMRWPGRVAPGQECRKLASTIDLLPTIAAICSASLPARKIDGVNILPLLEGDPHATPRDEFLYYYDGELQAVRKGKWKLHFPHTYRSYVGVVPGKDGHPGPYASGKTGLELYDLEADPGERHDVAGDHPEVVRSLQALGAAAREDLGDTITKAKGRGVRAPGRAGKARSGPVKSLAAGSHITLVHPPSASYPGAGDATLIDGLRGSYDHTDGAWQGFEGVDLDAVIDLGEERVVTSVSAGFLENQGAWIFPPRETEIALSADGRTYTSLGTRKIDRPAFDRTPRVEEIAMRPDVPAHARYVRVTARSVGICPPWHPGAGKNAWLFADEIVVA